MFQRTRFQRKTPASLGCATLTTTQAAAGQRRSARLRRLRAAGLRCAALLAALFSSSAYSAEHGAGYCNQDKLQRPSIGLALGGGGARGSAHIGILRTLEEMRIPVDYIAGTSMGSLVGALYATGMTADELEDVILAIDWDSLFSDDTARVERPFRRKRDDDLALYGPKLGLGEGSTLLAQGAISGQKISVLFEQLVRQRSTVDDFSQLPIPYRAITTDLATGKAVVLSEGDLALAMRASMSVPGVFDPVVWGEHLLVDGGLVNNVPLDVVRDMGADIVIAVDVGTGLTPREDLTNVVAALSQLTSFLTTQNVERNLATLHETDILIQPPLGDAVTSASFSKASTGISIGYDAAQQARSQLQSLALSEAQYQSYRQGKDNCSTPFKRVDFVRLENHSRFADAVIMEQVAVQAGDAVDYAALDKTVTDIYALGFLQLARYEIIEEDGATGLVIHVTQDSRGTQFLETGMDFSGNGDSTAINLRVAYLNTALDAYGSELRALAQVGEDPGLMLDLYKYFEPELKLFMQPRLFAERREIIRYDEGDAISISQVSQYGGSFGIGREFSRHAVMSGGVRMFTGGADIEVGPPGTPDFDFNGGEYYLAGVYDRLDDRYFPGHGMLAAVGYFDSRDHLGADDDYKQLTLDAFIARSFQRHSFLAGLRYNETIEGEAPEYALFRAGGFTRLSGYRRQELNGQNFGMVLGGYRYHVAGSGLLPAFVGGTLEYGQVAQNANDVFDDGEYHGSVYFGYRSPIGPLYLGIGANEDGDHTYFFQIGNIFGNSSLTR